MKTTDTNQRARLEGIILAAGRGTRFGAPGSTHIPKALLGGKEGRPLLCESIHNLAASECFGRFLVVTGHHRSMIDEVLRSMVMPVSLEAVHNPDYRDKGPLLSLRVAMARLTPGTPFCVFNGDTWYAPGFFACFKTRMPKADDVYLLVSTEKNPAADDIKIRLDHEKAVLEASKKIRNDAAGGISSGGLVIGSGAADYFRRQIEVLSDSPDTWNLPWHSLVQSYSCAGGRVRPLWVPRESWWEIDTLDDHRELFNSSGT